jgi:prepilin-type N-terminal cleavage/methylation domain-containing protein
MIHLRAARYGGQDGGQDARGFSLIELLIALTISALVCASLAVVVTPARAAFEVTPAEIDLQQRGRSAVEVIVQAIRAAGADAVASEEFGSLSGVIPAVILWDIDADGRFTRLKVIAHRINAAQGVLDRHQAGPSGALALALDRCPSAAVVCGFARDTTALIADGSGRFDLFTVATADAATHRITARRSLSAAYAAGSFVLEVDVYTFQLDTQPDGSRTLVRVTAAGAVQPLVDRVSALAFEPYAIDEAGTPAPMPAGVLTDGPWLRGDPDGSYDDDMFRVKRVDVRLTLQGAAPSTSERTLRFGVFLRNVP